MVTTNVVDHLQAKCTACHKQTQALLKQLNQLQGELTELKQRQKIAIDNAYADGYRDGCADATKRRGA